MKHTLTVALCVLAIVIVGALSVQTYNRYRVERNAHNAAVTAQAKSQASKQAQFNAQVNSLKALCQKDYATYQALSPAQKAKQQAPNCSLQIVQ